MTARRRYAVAATVLAAPAVVLSQVPASAAVSASAAPADRAPSATRVVIQWNRAMTASMRSAMLGGSAGGRAGAIVQAAVFDAVNGITHRYQPYFERNTGPENASPTAAAIGAASRTLGVLIPTSASTFDRLRLRTLHELPARNRQQRSAVAGGLAWGRKVADDILAWRSTDGYTTVPPTYTPTPAPGRWQPTPPDYLMPVLRQFATMVPFTMTSPHQFLPPPPPALTTRRYARDYAEVKKYGSLHSTARSAYGTETALLWQSDSPTSFWNTVADRLLLARRYALAPVTRLLARLNLAMGDAAIAVWNAKNFYDTWRPITAIRRGGTDGNPATRPAHHWTPLLPTPPFQEYPSGHVGLSSAGADVLAQAFGARTRIAISTPLDPGVVHRFGSFRSALADLVNARIFIGYHFRFSCDTPLRLGQQIASWVDATQMTRR